MRDVEQPWTHPSVYEMIQYSFNDRNGALRTDKDLTND